MLGSDWRAYRAHARLRRRKFRAWLRDMRPAIFYLAVTLIFLIAYVATTRTPRNDVRGTPQREAAHGIEAHVVERDANDRIADYTLGLEWFTGFLAIFALIEIAVLIRTEDAMRKSIEIAHRQMRVTGIQTDIIDKQKEIARLQYFAEHRPRLIIKDVFFSQPNIFNEVTFELVNTGGSVASVIDCFVGVEFASDPRHEFNRLLPKCCLEDGKWQSRCLGPPVHGARNGTLWRRSGSQQLRPDRRCPQRPTGRH